MKPSRFPFSVTFFLLAVLFAVSGCRPSNDVAEVSVQQSGVELRPASEKIVEVAWPAWRGPSGDGQSDATDVPSEWSNTRGIRWKADVPGRGHGSPVLLDELVIIPTAIEAEEKQMVLAYNRSTGEEAWQTVVHSGNFPSRSEMHQKGSHANGTLATDGARLYAVFLNDDKVYATALSFAGETVWQREVGEFASKFGYAPSPLIYRSFLIVAADNFGGGYLAALDTDTGEVAWRVARSNASSYSSPTVATLGGHHQLLISGGNSITSYDPATGEQLWSTPAIAEATCGTIVTWRDKLFASGGYPERETVCLSAEGERLWSNRTKLYEPSLVTTNDLLFGVTDDGIAHCWKAETGELQWKERLGGSFSASPIIAEGRVYVPNLDGETFIFEATSEGYQQVAKNELGSDCYASPAAAEGELYLRVGTNPSDGRQEQLVCITGADDAG